MARLKNLQHEAFCILVELQGWSRTDAYEGCGYKRDRANASAFAEKAEIAARRRELQEERKVIEAATGESALRRIMIEGLQTGDLGPAATAARLLAEGDGSLRRLGQQAEEMSLGQMLALAEKLDPMMALRAAQLLMLLDEDLKPMPPWQDGHGRPVPPYINPETGKLVE
jgi:hypothetical protein